MNIYSVASCMNRDIYCIRNSTEVGIVFAKKLLRQIYVRKSQFGLFIADNFDSSSFYHIF